MSNKTNSYEAFISYRHNPRDSFIAKIISRQTEGYRIPTAKLRRELGRKKVGKLFRDEDELPFGGVLNDAITAAINNSQKFIMLLSADYLDEEHWCLYELAEFLKTHHYRDVVVIVSSGDIASLTARTCEVMRKRGFNFYGDVDITGKPVDPFAVELTPYEDEKSLRKALSSKRLKLLAGILSVDYDDLNRRERRKRVQRRWAVLSPVFAAVTAFAITVTLMAININTQKIATQMNEMSLLLESSKNAVANGDRLAGMRYALDSLAIYETVYPDGDTERLDAIKQALEGSVYFGNLQLLAPIDNNNRKFGDMVFSPDDSYILGMLGHHNDAAIIDAQSGETLYTLNRVRPYGDYALTSYSFSPSGEYFLTGFGVYSCELVIWKTGDTPVEASTLDIDENYIEGKFLSEYEIIFCAAPGFFEENEVRVWDFVTGKTRKPTKTELANYREQAQLDMQNQAYDGQLSAKLSPDGRVRYESWGVSSEQGIKCYDVASGREIGQITEAEVVLAVSHDNGRLIAGSGSGFLGIYSTPHSSDISVRDNYNGKLYEYPTFVKPDMSDLPELKSNHYVNTDAYPIPSVTWRRDPTKRFIAYVHPDAHVDVWDMEQDKDFPVYGLQEHLSGVVGIFMTDTHLVTAGWDGKIILVDLFSGALEKCISVPESVAAINLDPSDTRVIALATTLKCAYVYDLTSGMQLMRLDAEVDDTLNYDGRYVSAVGFSSDGSRALANEKSGRVVVGKILLTFDELRDRAEAVVGQ